ncbi:MAG: hypothetical protein JEZ06_24815 [Anaerolineaceae bacterium]|nr:hypothetical protein [Anaerolineaceae bacterium]
MKIKIKKNELLWLALVLLALAVVFSPIYYQNIFVHNFNDYPAHIGYVESLARGEEIPGFVLSHPLWQYLVLFAAKLPKIHFKSGALLVTLFSTLVLGLVTFYYLRDLFLKHKNVKSLLLTIGLLITTPLFFLYGKDALQYLGYIGITTYHNSTVILLKPIALLSFLIGLRVFGYKKNPLWMIAAAFVLSVLSPLAKPNYVLCILPALGIFTVIYWLQKKDLDWKLLIIGFFIPSVGVLVWQFLLTYTSNEPGIIFAPFGVWKAYSEYLLPKFLLSIWFPLLVSLVYFNEARKDKSMLFAWLNFAFGLFFTYFLAEDGARFIHGNFGWGGEITLLILMIVNLGFLLKKLAADKIRKNWVLLIVGFMPHVIFGLIYYVYCFSNNTFF